VFIVCDTPVGARGFHSFSGALGQELFLGLPKRVERDGLPPGCCLAFLGGLRIVAGLKLYWDVVTSSAVPEQIKIAGTVPLLVRISSASGRY